MYTSMLSIEATVDNADSNDKYSSIFKKKTTFKTKQASYYYYYYCCDWYLNTVLHIYRCLVPKREETYLQYFLLLTKVLKETKMSCQS